MGIRVLVHSQYCAEVAAGVPDARATHEYKTFEVEAPELERYMRDRAHGYVARQFVGVELIEPKGPARSTSEGEA
jgi:hypothetical protein